MNKFKAVIYYKGEPLKTITKFLTFEVDCLDRGSVSNTTEIGVYSNKGKISFYDKDDIVKSKIKYESFKEDFVINIYYSGEYSDGAIAVLYIDDFEYDEVAHIIKLQLTDSMIFLQGENIESKNIYDNKSITGILKDNIFENEEPFEVKDDIYIMCPFIEYGNKWSVLSEICASNFLRCFTNEYGVPTLSRDEPTKEDLEKPIIINPKNILKIENPIFSYKTSLPNISLESRLITKRENAILDGQKSFNWYEWRPVSDDRNDWVWVGTGDLNSTEYNALFGYGVRATATLNVPSTLKKINESLEISGYSWDRLDGRKAFSTTNGYTPDKQSIIWNEKENTISIEFEEDQAKEETDFGGISSLILNGKVWLRGSYYVEDGTTKDIALTDSKKSIKELPTSSFVQFSNNNTQNIVEYARRRYFYGVECVEITCLIDDFFNTEGNLVLERAEGQYIRRYSVVIPYVKRHGDIIPYSTYTDGSPKKFVVIGNKFIYEGIPKQKLYLQEYSQNTLFGTWLFYSDVYSFNYSADINEIVSAKSRYYNEDEGTSYDFNVKRIAVYGDRNVEIHGIDSQGNLIVNYFKEMYDGWRSSIKDSKGNEISDSYIPQEYIDGCTMLSFFESNDDVYNPIFCSQDLYDFIQNNMYIISNSI